MPKELALALSKFLLTSDASEFTIKELSPDDLLSMLDSTKTQEAPAAETFAQCPTSYKVRHMNGAVSIVDIAAVIFAQVFENEIHLSWENKHLRFTTVEDGNLFWISQAEFDALAAFLKQ